mgnify:CR=1 FL=1
MNLYEFQSKRIFSENGIPIPRGRCVESAEEAAQVASEIQRSVVVKAQVLVGGRGLAGGVRFAENPEETGKVASQILGGMVKGQKTRIVLVEEKLEASSELYAGVTYDFRMKCPVIVASSRGGVDIETVAREHPQDIARITIDSLRGFSPYIGRELASEIRLKANVSFQYANVVAALWHIFKRYDAELVEANPLAIVGDRLVALDAKLSLDEKASFRQKDLMDRIEQIPIDRLEGFEIRRYRARQMGIPTYIEMEGNLGVVADGAGTGMLTLDLIADSAGKTGVYCEMGGETTMELMENALKAVLSVDRTRVVLVNLIGGLNRMDEMAKGITSYLTKNPTRIPIVVRMSGTMEEEGRRILREIEIHAYDDLYEAVQEAVHLSR